jgi:hypothetical protein
LLHTLTKGAEKMLTLEEYETLVIAGHKLVELTKDGRERDTQAMEEATAYAKSLLKTNRELVPELFVRIMEGKI